MLFLHMLLFFSLGTSVVALLPDYQNEEHRLRVQRQRPLLFVAFVGSLLAGSRWFYRIPTEGGLSHDDVFEIYHDGSIMFYQLNAKPGEGLSSIHVPVLLTVHNAERILGPWRPMPSSDVPINIRFHQVTFYVDRTSHKIEYHHFRVRAPTMLKSSSGTDGKHAKLSLPAAKGTWYRTPTEDAHEGDCNDVITLNDESSPKLYTLTRSTIDKTGEMSLVTEVVSEDRLVGIWRRMPGASVPLAQRNDMLKISKASQVGGLLYQPSNSVGPNPLPPSVAAVAA